MRKSLFLKLFLIIGIFVFALFLWWLMFIYNKKPIFSIENLKFVYQRDLNNFYKYQEFAKKAKNKDSLLDVATLFYAISLSDYAHSNIAKFYLKQLNADTNFVMVDFFIKKSEKNLEEAVRYSKYDVDIMYPQFIKAAHKESVDSIELSLSRMFETEKQHFKLFNLALQAAKSKQSNKLNDAYLICNACGFIEFDNLDVKHCKFCNSSKLIKINKENVSMLY